jgi:hypothetical protein
MEPVGTLKLILTQALELCSSSVPCRQKKLFTTMGGLMDGYNLLKYHRKKKSFVYPFVCGFIKKVISLRSQKAMKMSISR